MNEIAIASIPIQKWEAPDESEEALVCGSIFQELRKPFFIEEQMKSKKTCCCGREEGESALREIQQSQFFLIDLQLYLDTHPDEADAKNLKKQYQQKCKELMAQFAKEHYPLTITCEGDEKKAEIPWEGGSAHVAL
ncbi:MAG: spore coat protein CotJB [Lachnospira sp.]|jgi:hypothetical protein|nr:spore coat protein CotJB [Lachnospira sp.]